VKLPSTTRGLARSRIKERTKKSIKSTRTPTGEILRDDPAATTKKKKRGGG